MLLLLKRSSLYQIVKKICHLMKCITLRMPGDCNSVGDVQVMNNFSRILADMKEGRGDFRPTQLRGDSR